MPMWPRKSSKTGKENLKEQTKIKKKWKKKNTLCH